MLQVGELVIHKHDYYGKVAKIVKVSKWLGVTKVKVLYPDGNYLRGDAHYFERADGSDN